MHVWNEYDYNFCSSKIELILEVISYVYNNSTKKTLEVYKVPGNSNELKKYITSKEDAKLLKNILPPQNLLQHHEAAIIKKTAR